MSRWLSSCQLYPLNAFGEDVKWKCFTIFLDILLTPIFVLYWSFAIFIFPCLRSIFGNCCWNCLFLSNYLKRIFRFKDPEFECDDENAGKVGVKWFRLDEMTIPKVVTPGKRNKSTTVGRLFDKIHPSDVAQGGLGDCWLLAALATLSEKPQLIQQCFLTLNFNPRSKYELRLYDRSTKTFKKIIIDDFIPCTSSGTPIYTHLNSNEMWPLLLEKAFAKMRGGYGKLNGGLPLDAMETMTGYSGSRMFIGRDDLNGPIFHKLRRYHDAGCIMACGTRGTDNTREYGRDSVKGSIVGGHAYSILGVYEPKLSTEKVRLLKLRNPWGSFEWKGTWSDGCENWKNYPGVALEVGKPAMVDDGIFYMEWRDFVKFYDLIDILYPGTNIADTHITIHEECGPVGPVAGCILGLGNFLLCFQGLYRLWGAESSEDMAHRLAKSDDLDLHKV